VFLIVREYHRPLLWCFYDVAKSFSIYLLTYLSMYSYVTDHYWLVLVCLQE